MLSYSPGAGGSTGNTLAFLASAGLGIALLVFINAAQAFVLLHILHVPSHKVGKVSGTLVFAEELVVLLMVLVWGRVSDRTSPRLVMTLANILAGIALILFVQAQNVYPQLLLARLLFASGSAGITAMLSANLSILSSTSIPRSASIDLDVDDERQPLLGWRRRMPSSAKPEAAKNRHTRLAAFLGIATGVGALIAVFGFLRLPNALSADPATGLRKTFTLVGCVAFLNAIISFVGLPRATVTVTHGSGILSEITKLGRGFKLATSDKQVALGFVAGFVARAQVITVSVFIPLWVASYYRKEGLCTPNSDTDLKTGCHAAYALASTITGVIQLIALLFSPFLSFVRTIPRTLAVTFFLGVLACFALGRSVFHLGGNNPRNAMTWISSIGIGVAQISGIVLSLALIASARGRLMGKSDADEDILTEPLEENDETAVAPTGDASLLESVSEHVVPSEQKPVGGQDSTEEIAGALAGAYSFAGGLGILFVSGIGGLLADKHPGMPFILVAALDAIVAVFALAVQLTSKNQDSITATT